MARTSASCPQPFVGSSAGTLASSSGMSPFARDVANITSAPARSLSTIPQSSSPDGQNVDHGPPQASRLNKLHRRYLSLSDPVTSKKKSSVLSFFSVREPSSQAFTEYQETLRRHQKTRGARPSTVGLAMVSSTKMPKDVPKVNSKWEGVPDAMARKPKEKKPSGMSPTTTPTLSRASTSSRSSSAASRQFRNPNNSAASVHSFCATSRPPDSDALLWPQLGGNWTAGTMTPAPPSTPSLASPPLPTPNSGTGYFLTTSKELPLETEEDRWSKASLLNHGSRSPTTNTTSRNWPPTPPPYSQHKPARGGSGGVQQHLSELSTDVSTPISRSDRTVSSHDDSSRVIIQSSGPRILPPPASAMRHKPASIKSQDLSSSEGALPPSILKKAGTQSSTSSNSSHRPCLSSYSPPAIWMGGGSVWLQQTSELEAPLKGTLVDHPKRSTSAWVPVESEAAKKKTSKLKSLFKP